MLPRRREYLKVFSAVPRARGIRVAHWIHPRAARGAQGAGALMVVHALLQPRADDLPHNELRWQGCRVRPVLVRVRGVLSGLEEGPAGVDAPRCLHHRREIRGVISEWVRNVLLDVDHGLVEDGPDDEVNELEWWRTGVSD